MKTYKNFLAMVRWNDPEILNDLVGWMRRCAFDEVRLNIPRPTETPKWQSKTAANAKKNALRKQWQLERRFSMNMGMCSTSITTAADSRLKISIG